MAHFDKDGIAVQADGSPFKRNQSGVIVASEAQLQELADSFSGSQTITEELKSFVYKMHFEEGFTFDQMLLTTHIMVPIVRGSIDDHLRSQIEDLQYDQKQNEKIIADLRKKLDEYERKEKVDTTSDNDASEEETTTDS